MKRAGILVIGGVYVDINVPQFPLGEDGLHLETEIVGQGYQLEPGGSAVNFARICGALGLPTTFIGKVGDDVLGSVLTQLLAEVGIGSTLVVSKDVSTNVSFNMVNPADKSIMAVVGTANQSLTADEVYARAFAQLATSAYLFLGGCLKLKKLLPAFVRLVGDAKAAGVKVVLDHARVPHEATEDEQEIVRQLALLSDVYLPSADEFRELWGVPSIEEGLWRLSKQSSGVTIVKNGAEGVVTMINGRLTAIPAFSVNPIHTIGAGDSFNAGFMAAQRKGENVVESIRFGCATAALKISQKQAPTYEEVVGFMAR